MLTIPLAEHQIKAVRHLKNGAILKGGVGTGKSRTSLAYFAVGVCDFGSLTAHGVSIDVKRTPKVTKDLYVITTARKRDSLDWEGEAVKFGITGHKETHLYDFKMVVGSWNSIGKFKDVKGAFFIFDEQRLMGHGAWVKSFLEITRHNEWILLTATPGDSWINYAPVFIANGFYKNRTEFTREHCVYSRNTRYPKIERYVSTGRLERFRRDITVEMTFERKTRRHIVRVPVQYDRDLMDLVMKKRWDPWNEEPIQETGGYFHLMRKATNQSSARLDAVVEIAQKHDRLIVFYNFDYELEILRTLDDILGVPVAEWNGHKHEEVPDSEKWVYLVQYTSGAEAWNCITTNAIAFYSLNYSHWILEQSMGRIDRMNTLYSDLYYYMISSSAPIDIQILKALKAKKKFNESTFQLPK